MIVDPKVTREKSELETLVMSDLKEIREISVSKEKSELETPDLRGIREIWVSIQKPCFSRFGNDLNYLVSIIHSFNIFIS